MSVSAEVKTVKMEELPALSSAAAQAINELLASEPIVLEANAVKYHWHWCYPDPETRSPLVLTGDQASYAISFVCNRFGESQDRAHNLDDYDEPTACLLWSAIYSDFLECLQIAISDTVIVSQIDLPPSQQANSDSDVERTGLEQQCVGFEVFAVADNHRLVGKGCITAPLNTIQGFSRLAKQVLNHGFNINHELSVHIDRVSVSAEDLASMVPGTIVRLDNRSVFGADASASIVLGDSVIDLSITGSQATVTNIRANHQPHSQ